jgi:chromosome segregation ATPase
MQIANNSLGETKKTVRELTRDVTVLQSDMKQMGSFSGRIDTAIEKLSNVSGDLKSMLAVHEEKLSRAEISDEQLSDLIEVRRQEILTDIKDLHSRINSQSKELREAIQDTMKSAKAGHNEIRDEIGKMKNKIEDRVGVLEKWRWLIIGGAILLTFLIQHMEWFN